MDGPVSISAPQGGTNQLQTGSPQTAEFHPFTVQEARRTASRCWPRLVPSQAGSFPGWFLPRLVPSQAVREELVQASPRPWRGPAARGAAGLVGTGPRLCLHLPALCPFWSHKDLVLLDYGLRAVRVASLSLDGTRGEALSKQSHGYQGSG